MCIPARPDIHGERVAQRSRNRGRARRDNRDIARACGKRACTKVDGERGGGGGGDRIKGTGEAREVSAGGIQRDLLPGLDGVPGNHQRGVIHHGVAGAG